MASIISNIENLIVSLILITSPVFLTAVVSNSTLQVGAGKSIISITTFNSIVNATAISNGSVCQLVTAFVSNTTVRTNHRGACNILAGLHPAATPFSDIIRLERFRQTKTCRSRRAFGAGGLQLTLHHFIENANSTKRGGCVLNANIPWFTARLEDAGIDHALTQIRLLCKETLFRGGRGIYTLMLRFDFVGRLDHGHSYTGAEEGAGGSKCCGE